MNNIEIKAYGDYKSNNYGTNAMKVTIGNLTLYFSYETIIAFIYKGNLTITKNNWQTTTGKHLNWINDDKSLRIPYNEFKEKIQELLNELNLNVYKS